MLNIFCIHLSLHNWKYVYWFMYFGVVVLYCCMHVCETLKSHTFPHPPLWNSQSADNRIHNSTNLDFGLQNPYVITASVYSMLNMTFQFYMVLIDACVVVGTTENMFIGSCMLCWCVVWVFCFHVCCVAWFAESMCFDSTCVFKASNIYIYIYIYTK